MSSSFVRTSFVGLLACAVLGTTAPSMAEGDGRSPRPGPGVAEPRPALEADGRNEIDPKDRDELLGKGWADSRDRSWTLQGDSSGLRVLVAEEANGYQWRTLTTLAEPGFETSHWIGNACAAEEKLVVAYAPREFTNESDLTERGAFTAIVDLSSGSVEKLPVQGSLAYFSPSCGSDGDALITQEGGEKLAGTRLIRVSPKSGRVSEPIEIAGQLTSAVTTPRGIVGADAGYLVRVGERGKLTPVARTAGVPFRLTAGPDGSLAYLERDHDNANARLVTRADIAAPSRTREGKLLATGPLSRSSLASSADHHVFLLGELEATGNLPDGVSATSAPAGSRVSTRGHLLTRVAELRPGGSSAAGDPSKLGLRIDGVLKRGGRKLEFDAYPAEDERGEGTSISPALGKGATRIKVTGGMSAPMVVPPGSPTNPNEAERACSVPRNDPRNQAMQPKPRQVEWAVNQLVQGSLTLSRPSNWKNLGMPAYSPSALFPPIALSGGGHVPSQILLGVFTQESNLWQSSRYALPGVTSNPLIGNYYGLDVSMSADEWKVNFADADCGYGVSQMTDGMRLAGKERPGEVALPYQTQRAVALDFAANIAAGHRLLQQKWNQTYNAGMKINNGDSSKIENWFFAVWAYNSGMHPASDAASNSGAWGVGWLNNPVNPRYPADRRAFLDTSATDAAHPQDWPYPEKVIGFAAQPISLLEAPNTFVPAFRPATWNGGTYGGPINRTNAKPPVTQFCDATNSCFPSSKFTPNSPEVSGEPAGPCAHKNASGLYDLKCWYHGPSTWKADCDSTCGMEFIRFVPGYAYQEDATTYAPLCTNAGLPTGAKIVDDVPDGTPSVRPNCPRFWTNAGTFTLNFKPAADGTYPGKIDFHQIGGGFGGHFWFTHTRTAGPLDVTATWKLNTTRVGPMEVLVALPDHGAHTSFATYSVATATGPVSRVVKQPSGQNRWVSLGAFSFNGYPQVTLTSVTANGTGDQDIAYDAVAFVPRTGTFKTQSVEAVSVFDEDQDIDVDPETSYMTSWQTPLESRQKLYDWALEKSNNILATPSCTTLATRCLAPSTQSAVSAWRSQVTSAGTSPTNHPDGNSIGTWIGFAQPYTDRPTTTTRPTWFSDDGRYKIRSKITANYLVDAYNKIIPGSWWLNFEHRTANTHLPQFMRNLFTAINNDYGVAPPNMTYAARNLNVHNGASRTINPITSGVLPGRAYAYAANYPWLGIVANTGGTCLAAEYVSGGSIGYRAFLGAEGGAPANRFKDYITALENNSQVPDSVRDLMEELRDMFFDPAEPPIGSVFHPAPPVWQNLKVGFCPNGTIQKVNGHPILRASHMPDLYLYHNGKAMTLTGTAATTAAPVMKGDFKSFSAAPDGPTGWWANPFGACDTDTGRSGNPWDMGSVGDSSEPGYDRSTAHSCLDKDVPMDPTRSSP